MVLKKAKEMFTKPTQDGATQTVNNLKGEAAALFREIQDKEAKAIKDLIKVKEAKEEVEIKLNKSIDRN
jgi:hypothetical protein